ncbi:hypothetical protein MiTs_03955 [Microcystis aeruginosa NIES-2521]|uniref:Uncharacterized protein n=1 Tax=Microcystis aeruginosa NIES-2521 TaxID=2303983 RepID=A0A5A5SBC9_MICAE|nr:hypothetical protein MiTs_03955 [Microcystis aeruginosa NIES-2521]
MFITERQQAIARQLQSVCKRTAFGGDSFVRVVHELNNLDMMNFDNLENIRQTEPLFLAFGLTLPSK